MFVCYFASPPVLVKLLHTGCFVYVLLPFCKPVSVFAAEFSKDDKQQCLRASLNTRVITLATRIKTDNNQANVPVSQSVRQ